MIRKALSRNTKNLLLNSSSNLLRSSITFKPLTPMSNNMYSSFYLARNFSKKNKKNQNLKKNQKGKTDDIDNEEDEEEIPDLIDFTEYELALDNLVSQAEEEIENLSFGSLQPSMLEPIEVKAYGDSVILMDLA